MLLFDHIKLYFVCKSIMAEQTCLQVSRGRQLVQGGPADGPETSCCGQRGAGRQTALHSDSTNTQHLYTAHHPSIKYMNLTPPWLLTDMFYSKEEHCNEGKSGETPSHMLLKWLISKIPRLSDVDRRADFTLCEYPWHNDSKYILTAGCQTSSRLQWVFSAACHKTSSSENL